MLNQRERRSWARSKFAVWKHVQLEVWAKDRELAGTRASVNTLTLEVQRLNKMCEERRKAEEALRQKWKRIEEFDSRRMELEAVYTALLRANMVLLAQEDWENDIAVDLGVMAGCWYIIIMSSDLWMCISVFLAYCTHLTNSASLCNRPKSGRE